MHNRSVMAAGVLLLAGQALAAPLSFGMLEAYDARRDRFERHFLIGDKLQQFEVGKKQLTLPPGDWVISEVATNAPDVKEEGGSTVVTEVAIGSLSLQDTASGDMLHLSTSLASNNPRISFTQLMGPCKVETVMDDGWEVVRQQRDSVREDRQSCVRLKARLQTGRDGARYLQLATATLESWKADYLIVDHLHSIQVTSDESLASLLQQPAMLAYLEQALVWGGRTKSDIARQMGW